MCVNVGYDINTLFQEARSRWLKPAEVMYILQNHEKYQFTEEAPQKPTSKVLYSCCIVFLCLGQLVVE